MKRKEKERKRKGGKEGRGNKGEKKEKGRKEAGKKGREGSRREQERVGPRRRLTLLILSPHYLPPIFFDKPGRRSCDLNASEAGYLNIQCNNSQLNCF